MNKKSNNFYDFLCSGIRNIAPAKFLCQMEHEKRKKIPRKIKKTIHPLSEWNAAEFF